MPLPPEKLKIVVRLSLENLDVFCLKPLRPLGDGELHRLAFLQAAEAARLDGREMHKNVFARLTADEAVALRIVKPLHCSLFQRSTLFCVNLNLLRRNR